MPMRLFVRQMFSKHAESIAKYLDKDQLKLYTLIWNRFVASQMTAAVTSTMKMTLSQNSHFHSKR